MYTVFMLLDECKVGQWVTVDNPEDGYESSLGAVGRITKLTDAPFPLTVLLAGGNRYVLEPSEVRLADDTEVLLAKLTL